MTGQPNAVPVAIIGGGQAGLAASWHLRAKGVAHVVFERARIGHAWRNRRWDSFCLVTPNWQCRLPGFPYAGDDPDGYMLKDQIVDYIEAFAVSFAPPVREGVAVTRVTRRRDGRFDLATQTETGPEPWIADQLLIATGGYDTPIIPPFAADLDPGILQIDTDAYRNPAQLPDGATLIVGTGQSGVQLMEDLHRAGRRVHLAVGSAPRAPRVYRGRDSTDWLHEIGHYALTVENHPQGEAVRDKTNHYMSGRDGGHEIDLRKFALAGVALHGSLAGMDGATARFRPDLAANLDAADASYLGIRTVIDAYIAENGIDAPPAPPFVKLWRPETETLDLDLAAAGIASVIWCIGFRADYSWIDLDIFDAKGRPVHRRGVSPVEGAYFLGLPWQNTWGSGRFLGVGADAAHVADAIEASLARGVAARCAS